MIPLLCSLALASAYGALGFASAQRLRRGGGASPWLRAGTVLALAAHGALLAYTLPRGDTLNLVLGDALSLTAALVLGTFVLTSAVAAVESMGVVLLPIAALSVLLALLPETAQPLRLPASAPLLAHIALSLLAYSVLALAALQALLLTYQDRHLRAHHAGGMVSALPPLWDMEKLLFQLLGWGFAALSLALLTGFVFLRDVFAPPLMQKTALSILAWAVFGVLLIGRRRAGWRGRTAARFALAGFALLLAAYLGSKLVAEVLA